MCAKNNNYKKKYVIYKKKIRTFLCAGSDFPKTKKYETIIEWQRRRYENTRAYSYTYSAILYKGLAYFAARISRFCAAVVGCGKCRKSASLACTEHTVTGAGAAVCCAYHRQTSIE